MKQLLFFLCCLELLFATYLINLLGPYVSSLLLLAISVSIGWVYLKIAAQPANLPEGNEIKLSPSVVRILQWAVFFALSFYTLSKLKYLWWQELTYPNPKNGTSDVIPQIATLVQRFLHGEQPYYDIPFGAYVLYPTYLPFQWLPYIPLELAHIDYRWLPAFAMWSACFYFFLTHRKAFANNIWDLALPFWPIVAWTVFVLNDNLSFIYSVEGLIAAYYFSVAESAKRRNAIMLAIMVSVCLLSRYSVVFWVPLCLALHFMAGRRKDVLIIGGTVLLFFIVVYWFPFLRKDPDIFMNGYNYHTRAAWQEWLHDLERNKGAANLYNGLGLTPYALKLLPGDEANVLRIYKIIHLVACTLCVVALGFAYWCTKAKYLLHNFLLFSFKIYLTVFYVFLQIPYRYLFLTPVFVSACLLGAAFRTSHVKEKQTFIT